MSSSHPLAKKSRRPARAASALDAGAEDVGTALARYYDLDLIDDPGDAAMYLRLAGKGGRRVLELCAGSGRISVPLALAGHHVTAVDRDPDMLQRARSAWKGQAERKAHGGSLTIVENDVSLLDLSERFDLVILALNSLLMLDSRDAQEATLRTIAHHLAPGGRAVIDVWLPDDGDLALYDGRIVLEWVRRDPHTDEHVAKLGSVLLARDTAQLDAAQPAKATVAEVTTFFDAWRDGLPARRTMRRDSVRFIGAPELLALVRQAGLVVSRRAGDYELAAFDDESERLVLVCRAGRSYGG